VGKQKALEKLRREKESVFSQYMQRIKIIKDEAEKLEKRALEHSRDVALSGGYEYYSMNENKILTEATHLRFASYKLGQLCNTMRELEGFDDSFKKIEEED
tara:strand:- start:72 stop:374 length:303 start_codon:yes stop_codon:yes gene_type:complete